MRILTTPLKYSGTGIYTLSISSPAGGGTNVTQRLRKIAIYGWALVMCRKGKKGNFDMGSVAQKVVSNSPVPVVMIPSTS